MIVADRFTVQDTLGTGGSAIVYRAHDRVLDRTVALKLLGEAESSQVDQSRFEREIKLTARLVHPSIVPLFDSGWHEGRLYYVMPCIEGTTLRGMLAEKGRVPTAQALRLAGDVAEALAYAHASGVVHRDIKPENIFTAAGRALVADFGIARAITAELDHTALTEQGIAIGTVAYMSPEQAMGERALDGRADVYSLGCVLFELLTGEPVFRGASSMNVLAQHLSADPRVKVRLPDAAPELVWLLEQLLAKERDERPATAVELVVAFHALASSSGESPVVSPVRAPAASPVASGASEADRVVTEARTLFGRGVQGGEGAESVLALARVLAEKESTAEAERIRLAAAAIDDNVGELPSSIGVMRLYWQDDYHGAGR